MKQTSLRKGYLLISVSILFFISSFAQSSESTSAVSLGIRGADYFLQNQSPEKLSRLEYGFQVNYFQSLSNDFLRLKFPFISGQITVMDKDTYYNDILVKQNYQSFGVALEMLLLKKSKTISPHLSFGTSYTHIGDGGNNIEIPIGVGIDFNLSNKWSIQLNSEYRTSLEEDRNSIGIFAGVKYRLPKKETEHELIDADFDEDGISDLLDDCPDEFGIALLNGCSDDFAIRNKTGNFYTINILSISEIRSLIVLLMENEDL